MKHSIKYLVFSLVVLSFLASCEPNNPFATGPVYNVEENLRLDSIKIEAYLDTAQIDSIYRIHDPSGIIVIVQEEGEGSRPNSGTVVYTDYIGSLIADGTVFDTTYEQVARDNNIYVENRIYRIFQFTVGSGFVIQGWDIAFRRLRPGSKAVFIIPSPFAYRSQTSNALIPPNSVLRFDVDFRGID